MPSGVRSKAQARISAIGNPAATSTMKTSSPRRALRRRGRESMRAAAGATQPRHTRPQPCKRCAVSVRRKSFRDSWRRHCPQFLTGDAALKQGNRNAATASVQLPGRRSVPKCNLGTRRPFVLIWMPCGYSRPVPRSPQASGYNFGARDARTFSKRASLRRGSQISFSLSSP